MTLEIKYKCTRCGKDEKDPNSGGMICACGGDRRPEGSLFGNPTVFDAYYDETFKTEFTSYRQQEKFGKGFKTKDHPDGLSLTNDDHKWRKEMKNLRKYRVDRKQEMFGGRYKPGSEARFDNKTQDFVPLRGSRRRRIYSIG